MNRRVPVLTAALLATLAITACAADPDADAGADAAAATEATTPPAASMEDGDGARAGLDQAIAGPWRDPANVARDRYRHPAETLAFFGVEPDDTVVEITPGGGWYAEILAPLVHLQEVITYVRSHHERWDGFGYPDRLSGDAIPLGGRIIGTVEIYDALTTSRPYQEKMPPEVAVERMRDLIGTVLDAALCFYPGAAPLRALVRERFGAPRPCSLPSPRRRMPTHATMRRSRTSSASRWRRRACGARRSTAGSAR